jgi:hypothetical protein
MTKAGTFTAEAVEALVARVEELEGDLALVKREKSTSGLGTTTGSQEPGSRKARCASSPTD